MKAFVISGGGARIVQSLKLIEEHLALGNAWPDLIVGTSAGGLLAFLLAHKGIIGARDEILNIKQRHDVFEGFAFFGPGKLGIWHSGPMQKIMKRVQSSSHATTPAFVCSYDMNLKDKVYLSVVARDYKTLASTACIPVLVEPIGSLVDGGLAENTPLKFAIDYGADEIDVFMCSAPEVSGFNPINGKFEMFLRCMEAMSLEIARDDLKVCQAKNDLGRKQIKVTLHTPKQNRLGVLDFHLIGDVYRQS